MKSRKYRPYIRRANGREKADSFRVAIRLALYQDRDRPFYVMVQRGFPNSASAVGGTKRELRQSPVPVALGRKTFRQWASNVQRYAMFGKAA